MILPVITITILLLCSWPSPNPILMEGTDGMANGWPFGLGNIHTRFRLAEMASERAAPPYPSPTLRCTSFSSLSSSNLDTESTASFFQDQSVPLGRLIGIRPANKGSFYYDRRRKMASGERSMLCKGQEEDEDGAAQGLCAPLLLHVIGKKGGRNGNGNGSTSAHNI